MPPKKYGSIADAHHVVRRCNYQTIERDATTNDVVGLHLSAMSLRPEIEEDYLSVNWLEGHAGTKAAQLKAIVAVHVKKSRSKRLSKESGLAVINAGQVVAIGLDHKRTLTVRLAAKAIDPTYTKIKGLPLDNSDQLLLSALADEAYKDFMLLKDIEALP